MTNRKIIAIIAATALAACLVALAGCGSSQSSAASSAASGSSASAAASESASAASAAASESASAASAAAASESASAASESAAAASASAAAASTTAADAYIGEEAAKAAALEDAGLTASDVTELDADLDLDDAIIHYDVDFKSGGMEYDYDIDAVTGDVLTSSSEVDD